DLRGWLERVVDRRAVVDRDRRHRHAVDVCDEPVAVVQRPLAQRRETLELLTTLAQAQLDRLPDGVRRGERSLARPAIPDGVAPEVGHPGGCDLTKQLGMHHNDSSSPCYPNH